MAPAARFRCNDHAVGGRQGDVGAKDRRYTPAGANTAGVSGAWSRRGKKAPAACSPRDLTVHPCGVSNRAIPAVRSRREYLPITTV